jgi:hypothetical protein
MVRRRTPLGVVGRGLFAAAIGTAAMDALAYARYRLDGGTSGALQWEFGGIDNWKEASAPGQVGRRLAEAWTGKPLSARYADLTNNLVHWGFGIQWGAAYGLVAASIDRPFWVLGPVYGAAVWSFGYVVLPLGHFYKPIWQYDPETLAKDLSSHLVYGTATALTFTVLSGRRRRRA